MARLALALLWLLAAVLVAGAVLTPLILAGLDATRGSDAAFSWSDRQQWLLARTAYIAAAGAAIGCAVGAAVAAVALAARGWRRTAVIWLAISTVLTPPYVYAYAWSLPLLPEGLMTASAPSGGLRTWLVTQGRAILCLGTWTSPLAAFVLAHAWRHRAAGVYRALLLDASAARAWLHCGLRILPGWIALAFLTCFAVCVTEFTVCHLCRVPTWNTEVLAALQASGSTGGAWRFATPALVLVLLVIAVVLARRGLLRELIADIATAPLEAALPSSALRWSPARWASAWLGLSVALLAPWLLLLANLHDAAALARSLVVFWREWPDGLMVAAICAAGCAALAVAVDAAELRVESLRRSAGRGALRAGVRAVVVLALVAALLPGVLIGDAFALAIARCPDWLRDSAAPVAGVGVARFALLPIVWMLLDRRAERAGLLNLAACDGAAWPLAYFRVGLPAARAALLRGSAAAGVLCLTEVTATQFVVPPGLRSLSVTLLNEIHFGRQDEVIALCLWLLASLTLAAGLLAGVQRRPVAQEN